MSLNYTYIIIAFTISLTFSLICTPLIVKLCNILSSSKILPYHAAQNAVSFAVQDS